MSINESLNAVSARIKAAIDGDTGQVLDGKALSEATELRQAAAGPSGVPFEVGYAMGWFHWMRYLALPDGDDGDDLQEAVRWFGSVHQMDPRAAIPEQVLPYFAGDTADDDGHSRHAQEAVEILQGLQHADNPAALDRGIRLLTTAVDATPRDHSNLGLYLTVLGSALWNRFERTASPADLDAAISVQQQAVDGLDDPYLVQASSSLGIALWARYERAGAVADLDAAIAKLQRAVDATPRGDPYLAWRLDNLGRALLSRYERAGSIADLDAAVAIGHRVVDATPKGDPQSVRSLADLGAVLLARFERTGSIADLDAAVAIGHRVVDATPKGDPQSVRSLADLGAVLLARFERTGSIADLDAAVAIGHRVVDATSEDDPNRAGRLSNLGRALTTRFERTGSLADLEAAITTGQTAVNATPPDHPRRAIGLSNLGGALQLRFGRTGSLADINAAIAIGRQAIDATPEGHPNLAAYLSNLGVALLARFERTDVASDCREAVSLCSRAVASNSAPVSARLRAAQVGGRATVRSEGPAVAVEMYRTAIGLLPLLAWRGVSDADRRILLDREAASLARSAAACAIAADNLEQAVQFLEEGRGVIWAQQLDTRTDHGDLESAYPDVAAQLRDCRAVLDQPDSGQAPESSHSAGTTQPVRAADSARRDAARRFDVLVAQVRNLPPTAAFPHPQQFLRPPRVETLLPRHVDGPVVIVNVSQLRCDALVLTHQGVALVGLPDLTESDIVDTTNRYLRALQEYERSPRNVDGQVGTMATLLMEMAVTSTLEWLWDNITGPILDQLGYTTTPDNDRWPRVWWCPTGPLTSLPLHAAGHHTSLDGRTVYDRAVSSYTPTLRALTYTRIRPVTAAVDDRLLVIGLPNTPDMPRLPGADTEWQILTTLFGDGTTALVDAAATRTAIRMSLARHDWLHASCHGTQNLTAPDQGGLVPYDWQTAGLLGINDLTGPDHAGGEFAFLAACKTATGGVTNADETVSIVTALQYAGWRHVIGTMWSVWDYTAATITANLYPKLTHRGILDSIGVARALHQTLRALRDDDPTRPSTWAPFIHAGP